MRERSCCQAALADKAPSGVRYSCLNEAKVTRFGLSVCRAHARQLDRAAERHGDEFALLIARLEWRRAQACLPREEVA